MLARLTRLRKEPSPPTGEFRIGWIMIAAPVFFVPDEWVRPPARDGPSRGMELEEERLAGRQRAKSVVTVRLPEVNLIEVRAIREVPVPVRVSDGYVAPVRVHGSPSVVRGQTLTRVARRPWVASPPQTSRRPLPACYVAT